MPGHPFSRALIAGLSSLAPVAAVCAQAPELHGGVTAVGQYAPDDGIDPSATVSADLFATLPGENGEWLIYLEGSSTVQPDDVSGLLPETNADAGTAVDGDGGGRLQVSELHYTLHHEGTALTAGLIDPTAYLDRSRLTDDENIQFLGEPFVDNPTIAFPDYAPGLVYQQQGEGAAPQLNLLLSSSHGLADNPGRTYGALLDDDGKKGLFAGMGAIWEDDVRVLRLGGWLQTASDAPPGQAPEDREYGLYSVLTRSFGAHSWNLRLGLAERDAGEAERYASLSYRYVLGQSIAGAGISHAVPADSSDEREVGDTSLLEVFYRRALSADMHLTPSLQYLVNSGFDRSDQPLDRRQLVFSLRLRAEF